MTTPLTLEWTLVTEGLEQRVENRENCFTLTLDGYRLYPIQEQIEITRHKSSDQIGFGKIVELTWRDNQTICMYQLISLYSVN
ncbi:Protein of unknown function [Amphibacillus marinus]|uniref:DUF2584 domain-containing protein n=1 Tax=Amphibacillus marinus TaxID=872970 RepID=A0A1H8GLK6_9BACI|nr:DUF2584 family protein [Amphibacillus marinus]SEN44892.1 Protein of unknown function [Amphibacillus marinus]